MRWKIGTGKRIRVWLDSWLDVGTGRVISPRGSWLSDTTLDAFIDQDSKSRNKELARASFIPFETDRILSIPISRREVEDELYWGGSGDGVFRVKDAYCIALG